jgi:hypothetical protein
MTARIDERRAARMSAAVIAVVLLVAGWRDARAAEILDRVLAIAAGDVITLSDVNAAREFGLVEGIDKSASTLEVLSCLIDRSLMLSEVERNLPPEPDERDVAGVLAAIRGRFSGPAAFAETLARVGFGEPHLRALVRENLRIRAYLEQRFTVPALSQAEIKRYYEEHPEVSNKQGRRASLEEVRAEVTAGATKARRQSNIDQWVRGLRRRAEVTDLSVNGR